MFEFVQIKKLFNINTACGFSKEELSSILKSYGEIPTALWDYYEKLGAHEKLNNSQDFLIKPKDLEDYQALDYFVFYSDNQDVCAWGIKKEDMALDNPPVCENYDEDEWFQTTDTLTEMICKYVKA